MKKTTYYCDTCEKEVGGEYELYQAGLAIHKGSKNPVTCWLHVCEECIKETGFDPDGRDSSNSSNMGKSYKNWFKWIKDFLKSGEGKAE
ncbi:hypothetical protein FZC79_10360 [Rossellomorea vietnamensis]|uniref:Uncharacterized protein n=1 Tax=Rossellomorea vietnamensis TaxID=218284 RepID=A0A5D4KE20_9BACI|nr:hypothetical protein [Rossellomorea vietnamensis]TYR75564.1 hypothetical protein FZC79_10360 [Rossellomorea vietnamensis]